MQKKIVALSPHSISFELSRSTSMKKSYKTPKSRSQHTAADDVGLLRAILQVGAHVAPPGQKSHFMRRAIPLAVQLRPIEGKSEWKPTLSSVESRYYYLVHKRLNDPRLIQVVESEEIYRERNKLLDIVVRDLQTNKAKIASTSNPLSVEPTIFDSQPSLTPDEDQVSHHTDKEQHNNYRETPIVHAGRRKLDPGPSSNRPTKMRKTQSDSYKMPSWLQFKPAEDDDYGDTEYVPSPESEGEVESCKPQRTQLTDRKPIPHTTVDSDRSRLRDVERHIFYGHHQERLERFEARHHEFLARLKEQHARLEEQRRTFLADWNERKRRFESRMKTEQLMEKRELYLVKQEDNCVEAPLPNGQIGHSSENEREKGKHVQDVDDKHNHDPIILESTNTELEFEHYRP